MPNISLGSIAWPSPSCCDNKSDNASIPTADPYQGSGYLIYQTEQLITLWVLFVLVMCGNVVVLLLAIPARQAKPRMTFFAINLAITDLLTGLVTILTDIIWRYTGEFLANEAMCRIVRYLQVVLLYASTYVLVSLSIDRYLAIVHPMKFSRTDMRSRQLVAAAWCLSLLFASPTIALYTLKLLPNGEQQCWVVWADKEIFWTSYMTTVACLVFFIPLTVICVVYFFIVRTIWRKSSNAENVLKCRPVATTGNNDGYDGVQVDILPLETYRKAKMKTIKYSLAVIFAFVLCWSPYFMFDILDNFYLLAETEERNFALLIIQNLPALNSAINPLVYCAFSDNACHCIRLGLKTSWVSPVRLRKRQHDPRCLDRRNCSTHIPRVSTSPGRQDALRHNDATEISSSDIILTFLSETSSIKQQSAHAVLPRENVCVQ
ncbi:neuropeptide S receptor [Petromyzon marinus]|uniref:neuropeptide S receptor n=1 Tax=Petromyzon marinus TaxID=7757 RepID=UPI003F70FE32